MIVRLGYACISETLDITTSSTYTYSEYLKYNNLDKLDRVIKSNLVNLEKILIYNIKNNIHFYRLSSGLIPLATKKEVEFDYIDKYRKYYNRIAFLIHKYNIRVDFHLDQYCVLNSTRSEVVEATIDSLNYVYKVLEALKVKDKVIILHVGSSTFGKDNSIRRFINNYNKLPKYLKDAIVIENDDKVFNVNDVMRIYKETGVRIVLDYHHYNCNKSYINFRDIFNTWKGTPKVHFSSPKNKIEYRSHNDYINSDDFIKFIDKIKKYDRDIDIMIEAKKKDEALFRLVRELKYKTNYMFIDDSTFMV